MLQCKEQQPEIRKIMENEKKNSNIPLDAFRKV